MQDAEVRTRIQAGPPHRDTHANRPAGPVHDAAEAAPIDRDDGCRTAQRSTFSEQMLHPPQVARCFLADGTDEGHGAREPEVDLGEHARECEAGREATDIVGDTGRVDAAVTFSRGQRRVLRKHRVEDRKSTRLNSTNVKNSY